MTTIRPAAEVTPYGSLAMISGRPKSGPVRVSFCYRQGSPGNRGEGAGHACSAHRDTGAPLRGRTENRRGSMAVTVRRNAVANRRSGCRDDRRTPGAGRFSLAPPSIAAEQVPREGCLGRVSTVVRPTGRVQCVESRGRRECGGEHVVRSCIASAGANFAIDFRSPAIAPLLRRPEVPIPEVGATSDGNPVSESW